MTGVIVAARDANAAPGDPVDAAVKFFDACHAFRCQEVFALFSAGTQENIRARVHREERERAGLPQPERPEQKYCSWEGTLKRGTAHVVRQQGDEAVVAADFVVRVVSDRKFFPSHPTVTKELRLVREGGAWRVDLPRMPVGRPQHRLVEVGPVDVFFPARFTPGLTDRIEATFVVPAKRDALDAALRKATFWARALPSVTEVRNLDPAGGRERVQLSFAGTEQAVTVTVRYSSQPLSEGAEAAIIWDAEGSTKAPVYFRGSWRLAPYLDGTRITLLVVVNVKQWPGDVAEGMFSAARMAEALLGLQKAAAQ